jgi:hypothetical protein
MFPSLCYDQQERVVREVMNFVSAGETEQDAGERHFAAAHY